MRKYIKVENLEDNTNKALKFFEGLIKDDIIDYNTVINNAFYELGFEVNISSTKVDGPGGSITLKWAY